MATEDVPRSVPPYKREQISRTWWYCLHCCQAQPGKASMENHVRVQHVQDRDLAINEGEDFTNGDHLLILIGRWEQWSLIQVDRFAVQLASLRGADDFELEVGDGLPDS